MYTDGKVREQIAADAIEIVRREKVVGYEMSLMSQDELMELLGMTKVQPLEALCPALHLYFVLTSSAGVRRSMRGV